MKNKRFIPRHVDGRIMVGSMPIKNFFKALIIIGSLLLVTIKHISPIILFGFMALSGLTIIVFSEFNNKETGMDIIKDKIRYFIEGEIHFERGDLIANDQRFIQNKIKTNHNNQQ